MRFLFAANISWNLLHNNNYHPGLFLRYPQSQHSEKKEPSRFWIATAMINGVSKHTDEDLDWS